MAENSLFSPGIRNMATPAMDVGGGGSAFAGRPDIALQGQGGGYNPMAASSSAMNILTGMNQNKLFNLKLKSDVALGEALKDSVNPDTGEIDTVKFSTKVATDPLVALRAPEVLQQVHEARFKQLQNTKSEIDIAAAKAAGWGDLLRPIIDKGPNAAVEDVFNLLGEARRRKLYNPDDPKDAASMATRVSEMVGPGGGQGLANRARDAWMRTRDQQTQLASFGQQIQKDMGSYIETYQSRPVYGDQFKIGTHVKGPTPEAMNEVITVELPDGSKKTGPRHSLQQFIDGGGKVVSQPSGAAIATGPNIENRAYMQGATDAAIDDEKKLNAAAGQSVSSQVQFEELGELLDNGVRTGGGTEFRKDVARTTAGMIANLKNTLAATISDPERRAKKIEEIDKAQRDLADKLNGSKLGDTEEFAKFAVQSAMGILSSQLRGVTGSQVNTLNFATYLENNPSLLLDPRANKQILSYFQKMNERTLQEQAFLADRKKDADFKLSNFASEWNKEQQRRGYAKFDVEKDLKSALEASKKAYRSPSDTDVDKLIGGLGDDATFDNHFGPGAAHRSRTKRSTVK